MKRVLLLFGMIFVAACSTQDGEGYGYGWAEGPDGRPTESSADAEAPPPWTDASPIEPGADAGTDPSSDSGVYPDDAAALDGSCPPPPPPPPPPPCGCGNPIDAGAPDPDAG